MELPISGRLGQDTTEGEIGGIGFDGQGEFRLEVLEDGRRSEGRLELTESSPALSDHVNLTPFRVRVVRGVVRAE